jgi:hypothetical protein
MRRHRGPWALVTALLYDGMQAPTASDAHDPATTTDAPSTSAPTTTSAPSGTSTTAAGDDADVLVYFTRDEAVATPAAPCHPGVAGGAPRRTLFGPDELETGIDMATAIPGRHPL